MTSSKINLLSSEGSISPMTSSSMLMELSSLDQSQDHTVPQDESIRVDIKKSRAHRCVTIGFIVVFCIMSLSFCADPTYIRSADRSRISCDLFRTV